MKMKVLSTVCLLVALLSVVCCDDIECEDERECNPGECCVMFPPDAVPAAEQATTPSTTEPSATEESTTSAPARKRFINADGIEIVKAKCMPCLH